MKRSEIKKRPLSPAVLDGLEPELKEYRELDSEGLYFRVQPSGKKSWLFRYKKENGNWSWLSVGSYPATKAVTARKKAAEFLENIYSGVQLETKQKTKQKKIELGNLLFSVLMDDWLATKK